MTDSFVSREQTEIIKNLISAGSGMFENYLHTRRTIVDSALCTRELKILLDNHLFSAALLYIRSYPIRPAYNVIFANAPASIRALESDMDHTHIILHWYTIVAIRTNATDEHLFNAYKKWDLYDHGFKYQILDDPCITYEQVKKFLRAATARACYDVDRDISTKVINGAYRTARYILEHKNYHHLCAKHLPQLHAIEPLDIPLQTYINYARSGYCIRDLFKFLGGLNQERYDMLVDKVDWNSMSPTTRICVVFLSDGAFEHAMNMVWKDELVAMYSQGRGTRPVGKA